MGSLYVEGFFDLGIGRASKMEEDDSRDEKAQNCIWSLISAWFHFFYSFCPEGRYLPNATCLSIKKVDEQGRS